MSRPAPRSIDEYLRQLRAALDGQDPALIQDALYDAEEYLRAEIAAHPAKSEADALELIASTYGAPDEVAAAYLDTEAKVKAALATPRSAAAANASGLRRFFGVFADARSYTSLFYMLLALATGIIYFTFAVTGLSLSAGLAVLIVGVPFFLAFIGMTRIIALGEGRLLEAMTGERMPRRPQHPGAGRSFWQRIGDMLRDARTWTTLAYMLLMLPLGIVYFVIAVVGLALGVSLIVAPVAQTAQELGWGAGGIQWDTSGMHPQWLTSPVALILMVVLGVIILTTLMHLARGLARLHAMFAKKMLVEG
ncbi:MAG: sensor domain-containing protein [Steroidobacteraceae bacterium]